MVRGTQIKIALPSEKGDRWAKSKLVTQYCQSFIRGKKGVKSPDEGVNNSAWVVARASPYGAGYLLL